jgi:hypothetical protein
MEGTYRLEGGVEDTKRWFTPGGGPFPLFCWLKVRTYVRSFSLDLSETAQMNSLQPLIKQQLQLYLWSAGMHSILKNAEEGKSHVRCSDHSKHFFKLSKDRQEDK